MPVSEYIKGLREKIGYDLLLNPGVAALIHDSAGRVLLQRRSDDGSWSLPGGGVDPGESPAQAVIREAWEETGLKVVPIKIAGVFSGTHLRHTYPNGDQLELFSVVFLCHIVGGHLEGRDGESLELRYVAPNEIPKSGILNLYPRALYTFTKDDETLFAWDEKWLGTLV